MRLNPEGYFMSDKGIRNRERTKIARAKNNNNENSDGLSSKSTKPPVPLSERRFRALGPLLGLSCHSGAPVV